MYLQTQNLFLRPVIRQDAQDIFAYSKDSQIGENAGWKPHETLEETKEILETLFMEKPLIFAITQNNQPNVIGTIGLIPDPKRDNPNALMLGYSLSFSHWGKGIMTEAAKVVISYAFSYFDIPLITAYTYHFNTRSQNILKKCGFLQEGILRQAEQRFDGFVCDMVCFSLTKSEFDEKTTKIIWQVLSE